MGILINDPVLYSQSPAVELQRQVIKKKTLGRASDAPPPPPAQTEEKRKSESRAARIEQARAQALSQKAREEVIDKAAAMRHLRYEVVEGADIVQVSVINSEDGAIVRKVPSDKVIEFVKKFREKSSTMKGRARRRKHKLDIQA